MPNDLMKLVQSVLAQKRVLDAKERQLIDSLNRVLPDMGYRVVSASGASLTAPRRPGRPSGSSSRTPGSAPKNLVCAQCGRRFSHPLHLGRHTAATHKGSSAKASSGSTAKPSSARSAKATGKTRRRRRRTVKTARKAG
jgi:hypothetical protein